MTKLEQFAVSAVFGATLFLSAALMFSFQPMIGKMLLPLVGGSPAGWMVSLAFFQVTLLGGYYAAHILARFTPQRHAVFYLGLVGIGSLFLPVTLSKSTWLISDTPGPVTTFLLLAMTVAIPFFALSATSSTLQRLFTATGHPRARNPYFLYVASNLGSFVGLLSYPLFIEPAFGLMRQSAYWLFGYLALIVATVVCLGCAQRKVESSVESGTHDVVPWRQRVKWAWLAFVPSSLMMAVTFYDSTELVSMPLLWVIPLGLYLLTFIIAFSERKLVSQEWLMRAQPAVVILATAAVHVVQSAQDNLLKLPLNMLAFFIAAFMCHMLLAAARPSHSDRNLPLFYFSMSVGGALGGVLNAFVVPLIFKTAIEFPLMLLISCLPNTLFRPKKIMDSALLALGAVLFALTVHYQQYVQELIGAFGAATFGTITVLALISVHPRGAIIGGVLLALVTTLGMPQSLVYTGRNFHGVFKIYDADRQLKNSAAKFRYLINGNTVHGYQSLEPGEERETTSYYTKDGPLGEVFQTLHPKNIAAIGLGTGTIACYGTPDNEITFFDINPLVEKVAEKYFTFLSDCGTGAKPAIVIGDGRMALSRMSGKKYDLIILDAFASDSVPTHLLTKEAVGIYLDHLESGGMILFHVSNRHFALGYPIVAVAKLLHLDYRFVTCSPDNPYAEASSWVALARGGSTLENLKRLRWKTLTVPSYMRPWTDDYTNLLSTLRFGPLYPEEK